MKIQPVFWFCYKGIFRSWLFASLILLISLNTEAVCPECDRDANQATGGEPCAQCGTIDTPTSTTDDLRQAFLRLLQAYVDNPSQLDEDERDHIREIITAVRSGIESSIFYPKAVATAEEIIDSYESFNTEMTESEMNIMISPSVDKEKLIFILTLWSFIRDDFPNSHDVNIAIHSACASMTRLRQPLPLLDSNGLAFNTDLPFYGLILSSLLHTQPAPPTITNSLIGVLHNGILPAIPAYR